MPQLTYVPAQQVIPTRYKEVIAKGVIQLGVFGSWRRLEGTLKNQGNDTLKHLGHLEVQSEKEIVTKGVV